MEPGGSKNVGAGGVEPLPPSTTTSKKRQRSNKYALACSILASMTSILLGYDTGVMSGAGMYIKKDLKITDVQLEILNGTINIYSLLGSALAGRTSDWIGRRYTIVVAGCIFLAGAFLMGFATNYAFLMVGRFVAGIGIGYALMIAPVYTAEVFINAGVLLGYISNYAFSGLPQFLGWRIMLGAGAVPSAILAVVVLMMPESPRWLVMQGRLGEAKRVLDKTSNSKDEAKTRLADIMEAAGITSTANEETDVIEVPKRSRRGEGIWKELLLHPTPSVRRVLIAGVGIHFFQQASGVDAVVLYSPRIFEKAGITSNTHMLLATVAVGCSKAFFILVATFLLDRIGRRPLLLTSSGGMVASLLVLATGLRVIERASERVMWAIVVCIATVLSTVGFFSIGMGPIAWVYSSEIFPLRLRAQGASIGVAVNRVVSGVIGMTFISLYKAITISGAFYLFAGIATVGWLFFYTFLPETQGRTLEEMEELFDNFNWKTGMGKTKLNDSVGEHSTGNSC